jgi:hypothetical protein
VLWRDLGGVLIVLDGTTGRYFRLDGSATRIWRLINQHDSFEQIVSVLSHPHDGLGESVEHDVRVFVDSAVADGLLAVDEKSLGRPDHTMALAPLLQIQPAGLTVNGSIDILRNEFARNHYVHLPQFLEPGLLKIVNNRVHQGEFVDRTHHGIGTEQCLVPGIATSILQLAFNDPVLLQTVAAVADCGPVKCFDGRVYRMAPDGGHYDSWHSDAGEDRQIAVSVNLSPEPYEGGQLEIREATSTNASHVVSNVGFGNAVMFRISPALRHRVSAVTGSHARTAYAGWFRSSPDFQDLFFASLPKT